MDRRRFMKWLGLYSSGFLLGGCNSQKSPPSHDDPPVDYRNTVFVAKNGTPAQNIDKVIEMRFGGIDRFIGADDVVVINPNGQWSNQGASNCECCMALIDSILARPGGFDGEIVFCENTQFQLEGYWTAGAGGKIRNGPYNWNEMIQSYHDRGQTNVSGVRLWRNIDQPDDWPVIAGPASGQGWVRPEWRSPTTGCLFYLPYPIIRSPYSDRLIDLKNGVFDGTFDGQPPLKFIKMPNLNNHGNNANQDYAGITSAVKSFLGITELEGDYRGPFNDGHRHMHTYSDACHGGNKAFAAGEAVGAWMNHCRAPDVVITTAEWVGWGSRTGEDATRARTVGLADDPATLDYYMSKYVLWPLCTSQQYFNPDYDVSSNKTRQTIEGCVGMGYGTADESDIKKYVFDFDNPTVFGFDIDREFGEYFRGRSTMDEILELIEKFENRS